MHKRRKRQRKETHWPQKRNKGQNTESVKVWNFCFPFPLGEKASFQGSKIVKCYFSSISFEPHGNLKSRGYSSLVTVPFQNVFWNDFLKGFFFPPQRLHSHTSWDSLHCAAWIPPYLHGWNWKRFFSSVMPHLLPKYISCYILECRVAIWRYWFLIFRPANKSSLQPSLLSNPNYIPCINSSLYLFAIVSLGCIFMSL